MSLNNLGYVRVAACAPEVIIGDPEANADRMIAELKKFARDQVALVLFPELGLTGYTCEDLFFTQGLHKACERALTRLLAATKNITAVIGLPWQTTDGRLLNCALVASNGRVCGVVPKLTQPNYGEFYELRWFTGGGDVSETVNHNTLGTFQIDHRQLFDLGSGGSNARFAIEICEDLWTPQPPGAAHALAGADFILNPSASNELIGKADYRRDLVRMTSAQRLCAYLYASSGPTESTKDVVFGGHLLAAENGQQIAESARFELAGSRIVTEFDAQRLRHERMQNISFAQAPRTTGYRIVHCDTVIKPLKSLYRTYDKHPFVPDSAPQNSAEFDARATEIMSIQATGLARRMASAHINHLVLGLSGGLDSTQAFLVALDALSILGLDVSHLHAFTLPGPGTSKLTKGSAHKMCEVTGVSLEEISINKAVAGHLKDLGHPADAQDVVFENAQARERTQILFNQANKLSALVVGTGDLSELALGWCTFNADHMANYNVNAGVPKTMMSYLVRWYADHRANKELAKVLLRVLDTPISPELLPPAAGKITQSTETIIGPYELHDFFLYHFMRNGFEPEKIFVLAVNSFSGHYTAGVIKKVLHTFFRRFFTQQFKRTTLPPGPKIGSVSLSPRGDWRMPDEADVSAILKTIDALKVTKSAGRSTAAQKKLPKKTVKRKRS